MYSVQQLLFDAMSYLRAYGEEGVTWHVDVIGPERHGLEAGYAVWLHRPALSTRAAETVARRLQNRFGVQQRRQAPSSGRYLFLGKLKREGSA